MRLGRAFRRITVARLVDFPNYASSHYIFIRLYVYKYVHIHTCTAYTPESGKEKRRVREKVREETNFPGKEHSEKAFRLGLCHYFL